MPTRPELPPLREFGFDGRDLILKHKLKPLKQDGTIHRLENDHEVKTMWTTNSRGEGDIITVVRFRVLFGVREYADFLVTDDYHICRDRPDAELQKNAWDGDKLADYIRQVVADMQVAA